MVKINVLLENYSINDKLKAKHGLSIMIQHNEKNILLDVGPNNYFAKNAIKQNINLQNIDYLFLSHNHSDHTSGINEFMKLNNTAEVYLMDKINNKYYTKLLFFNIFIGTKLERKYYSRIKQIKNDISFNEKLYFLKNNTTEYKKPNFNKVLFKKENGKLINDTFEHEGILVLEDDNELIIFNSCSHNGVLNIIETVKKKIPNKNIRSYVGGLHLFNPITKEKESKEYLDYLIKNLGKMKINIYTGHCTGRSILEYLNNNLGKSINEINTGMEYNV